MRESSCNSESPRSGFFTLLCNKLVVIAPIELENEISIVSKVLVIKAITALAYPSHADERFPRDMLFD